MSGGATVNWEWQDDADAWTPYHFADNLLIETAFKTGTTTFTTTALSFNVGYDSKYVFDFTKKLQTNTESGRVRKLRRNVTDEDDTEDAGFVAMVKAVSFGGGTLMMHSPSHTSTPIAAGKKGPLGAHGHGDDSSEDDDAPTLKKGKGDDSKAIIDTTTSTTTIATTGSTTTTATSSSSVVPSVCAVLSADQSALGAQSRRKQPYNLGVVGKDVHGKFCFDRMLSREKQLSGEWAVFYHSYSYAALLYEVQSAVAAVLFRFKSEYATLPRLLKGPFNDLPDAEALLALFPKMKNRDHDPRFRAVAISGTSSLLADDSEAPPKTCFLHGYSCADLCFFGVLEGLLVSCGVPEKKKTELAKKIVAVSAENGLDVSQFKGKGCKSGRAGHMLQVFVKRSIVNKYVYGALPFGVKDKKRPDLEKYLQGSGPIAGQVRIVMNPSVFMRGNAVRMYVYSADPTFHANRPAFQKAVTDLLQPVIGTTDVRTKAAEGIYGGKLPPWFSADDYEEQQKAKAAAAAAAPPPPPPAAAAPTSP